MADNVQIRLAASNLGAIKVRFCLRTTKDHFLRYAGRYIRRLPISQKRILSVTREQVVYQSKDTRKKTFFESSCAPQILSPCSRNTSLIPISTRCATSACSRRGPSAEPQQPFFSFWGKSSDLDPVG